MSGVTIAVVSWNTRDLLRRCLDSLAPLHSSGVAETWVVDNGSGDGSPELVRAEFPWVRLVEAEENLGFGRAVNLVARRTAGEWIVAANADVAVTPGALEELLRVGPDVGAVAPRLVMPDGRTQHSVHPFPSLRLALAFNLGLAALLPGLGSRLLLEGKWKPHGAQRVDWAHGAFLAVRRAAFDAAGGFDEDQWMYAEDLDLCWRLRRAGWGVEYRPAAAVNHEVAASTTQAFADARTARHLRAAYRWMARRQGVAQARAYAAINAIGALARAALLALPARVAPQRFAARHRLERSYARLHLIGLRADRVGR